jgi:hypothetical protein
VGYIITKLTSVTKFLEAIIRYILVDEELPFLLEAVPQKPHQVLVAQVRYDGNLPVKFVYVPLGILEPFH